MTIIFTKSKEIITFSELYLSEETSTTGGRGKWGLFGHSTNRGNVECWRELPD